MRVDTAVLPSPWVPPWRAGLAQVRCHGEDPGGRPHGMVVACTVDEQGRCAVCREKTAPRPQLVVRDRVEPAQQALC